MVLVVNLASSMNQPETTIAVPLRVHRTAPLCAPWPVKTGIPFPQGVLFDPTMRCDWEEKPLPAQTDILGRWPDGSIKWLLLETILPIGCDDVRVTSVPYPSDAESPSPPDPIWRESGVQWTDSQGNEHFWSVDLESRLPGRSDVSVTNVVGSAGRLCHTFSACGEFNNADGIAWQVELEQWHSLDLVRVSLSIHNSRRAIHKGGLWDLGDPNSFFFDGLRFSTNFDASRTTEFRETPSSGVEKANVIHISQGSSGGENRENAIHVDRHGRNTIHFAGYRIRSDETESIIPGGRALPTLRCASQHTNVEVSVPEFWQQFPSALGYDGKISIDFFPPASGEFELQPGEKKCQSAWIATGDRLPAWSTATAHAPPMIRPAADWVDSANVVPLFVPSSKLHPQLATWIDQSSVATNRFVTKRERADVYGWRNYGEVYADHENLNFKGTGDVVSHYNNQYDLVQGFLLSWLTDGEAHAWELCDALARHVVDIDIYDTVHDRTVYNGGMFWHTDHYFTAHTATHRSYSKHNAQSGPYGGGPGCEHNYTTGLLHYYYLTGNQRVRDTVIQLADWVIAMDNGEANILSVLDTGPTGVASCSYSADYHGPSRGTGNSINALLDGWLLTEDDRYLEYAEALIQRAVHPDDDPLSVDLLNIEARWSYTVFFVVLGRYIDIKKTHDQENQMVEFAQECLRVYGQWMLDHERPYFEREEQLEFPTETWCAQDLRKANVMRLAAIYSPESRDELLKAGRRITEAAISKWQTFPNPTTTRAVALTMLEARREVELLERECEPVEDSHRAWPAKVPFETQKQRFKRMLRRPASVGKLLQAACRPAVWRMAWRQLRP